MALIKLGMMELPAQPLIKRLLIFSKQIQGVNLQLSRLLHQLLHQGATQALTAHLRHQINIGQPRTELLIGRHIL
jgi:hypothetical protein